MAVHHVHRDESAPVEILLGLLDGVKPLPAGGWTARCPAHDDRRNSLKVDEGADGRALVFCHAGCAIEAVVTALDLTMAALMPGSASGPRRFVDDGASCRIVATYDYRDEAGALLYQAVRYDPKGFAQRRPDGRGGWLWNLGAVRRVLYRLPDLIVADPSTPVYVTEGEKDADALVALGLVATTNAGGADKWRPEYAEALRGRHVIVLPDNDGPGRDHAGEVATSVSSVAATVLVVALPGLLPKGDVGDWLAAGGDVKALRRLCDQTPVWTPPRQHTAHAVEAEEGAGDVEADDSERRSLARVLEPEWPVLDDLALYGLPGDIVRALDPTTEADPVAVLVNVLLMFGNAVNHGPQVWVGDAQHGGNEFAVFVGESSKARKGTSMAGPRRLFRLADPAWEAGRIGDGLGSGEGLIWAIRDPIEKEEPVKENGKTVGTRAVVVDPGVTDKRLLVIEEEFASTLKVAGREGNTLSPVIRKAWDSPAALRTMTKNSPAVASGPHVSLIGHVTRDELLRHLDSTETANGFGNRYLWVCVRRSKVLPEGGRLSDDEAAAFGRRLADALALARKTAEVVRDADAKALWWDVYGDLSAGGPGLVNALTSRAEAHVLRLSLNYALLDCSAVIRLEHLAAALALWDYCFASARYIFGDATGDPIADAVHRALRGAEDGLTRTDITNLFGRNVKAAALDRALATLLAANVVRVFTRQSGGRPAEVWAAR